MDLSAGMLAGGDSRDDGDRLDDVICITAYKKERKQDEKSIAAVAYAFGAEHTGRLQKRGWCYWRRRRADEYDRDGLTDAEKGI